MARFQRRSMANDNTSTKHMVPPKKQLVVCALAAVPEMVTSSKASALVSALHPDLIPETPETIAPDNHFKLAIDDIESPFDGLHHAELKHIEALCAFVTTWHDQSHIADPDVTTTSIASAADRAGQLEPAGGSDALVVHCYAGISRSTAAAFVALCALNPKADEFAIASYLRRCSPTAAPNRLIVQHGDAVLGRQGRMTKAIRSIDRSLSHEPNHPFALQTKFDPAQKALFTGFEAA